MNGFRELHRHQVMHRDIKLANIFLHGDTVKIGDFGFAKQGVKMAETILGTPITMAPELLNSEKYKGKGYSNKTDLWALGVVFYQMVFGDAPWVS